MSTMTASFKPGMNLSAGAFNPSTKAAPFVPTQNNQQLNQNASDFKPKTTAEGHTPTPSAASTQPTQNNQAQASSFSMNASFTPNVNAKAWTPGAPQAQTPAAPPAPMQNQQWNQNQGQPNYQQFNPNPNYNNGMYQQPRANHFQGYQQPMQNM